MKNSKPLTITTSWDDGHPLDFRVAELLAKHGLRGTFYIPLYNCRPTLTADQICELASTFEVGAHTVHHVDLTDLSDDQARTEIYESKVRLEEITGKNCSVFCFPKGRYKHSHLAMAAGAGFLAVRTVELLSLDRPRKQRLVAVIPTTVQAYPHRRFAYVRNCAKRYSAGNLWNFLWHGNGRDWDSIAMSMLELAISHGGVFHLWGHSWEIEESGQWNALERVLKVLASAIESGHCRANSDLCTHAS